MSKYAFLKAIELKKASVKSEATAHKKERAVTHYITTKDTDWGGHVVDPAGMDSKMFEKHGTVFFNHDYAMPIATNMWIKPDDQGVMVKTRFAKTLFADDIYMMHEDGILKTWSIGWQPKMSKGEPVEGALSYDKANDILHINKWDLVEYSSAPLAMNPSALDQVKTFAKSDEVKGMIDTMKADLEVKRIIEKGDQEFKETLEKIKEQERLIEQADSRIEILESELAEMQDSFNKFMEKVKAESVETLGDIKDELKVDVDSLIAREVSRLFNK